MKIKFLFFFALLLNNINVNDLDNIMKKLLILLLCVPLIGFAQEHYISNEYFQEESYQYLIADDVNIRLGPSTKTSIVANLPIGTRLKIIEKLKYRYTYNNISFPWYKVSFFLNNRKKIGYVVGGFIAQDYHKDKEIIFLSGLSKYYPDGEITYQIRVAKENKEIDKIEFPPSDYGEFSFHVFNNEDINSGIYIIQSRFIVGACYAQPNETTLFFENNKLYHIKTFSNEDDKYLGFENGIIQVLESFGYDDPSLPPSEKDGVFNAWKVTVLEEYIWDNRRLKRIY